MLFRSAPAIGTGKRFPRCGPNRSRRTKSSTPRRGTPTTGNSAFLWRPKYDWDHLIIHPAETGAPYRIPITYDLPSNSPLPIITEAPHEWPLTKETKTVLTTFINGKPVNPSVAPRMLERICGIQNHVRNLTILPPEKYEADVLRVESGKKNE